MREEMISLQASQHIYGNVEEEQSPQRKGGFQTIFYTHSTLSEEEVEEMERRLFYHSSKVEPIKWLYFQAPGQRYAVAQITYIPERDKFGRKGRYIAHSLILDKENFKKINFNPFFVFRNFNFISTVEEAMIKGNLQTGDIPPLTVLLPKKEEIESASEWPADDLKKLSLLALRASQLLKERKTVAFIGEPENVKKAIEASLLAVPLPLRPNCTFDSYFYAGNIIATPYWGIGLLEKPSNPDFLLVDADSKNVLSEVDPSPHSLYERWLLNSFSYPNLKQINEHKDYAYALSLFLEGKEAETSLPDEIPYEVLNTFFKLFPKEMVSKIETKLIEQIPPPLAKHLSTYLFDKMPLQELFNGIRKGFAPAQLLDMLAQVYEKERYQPPKREELLALGEILKRKEHLTLRILYSCWRGFTKELRSMLEEMEEEKYREWVNKLLKHRLAKPFSLLVPGKSRIFSEVYIHNTRQPDLLSLMKAIIELGEYETLEFLVPNISFLKPEEVKFLNKLIKGRQDIPENFLKALEERHKDISLEGRSPGHRLMIFKKIIGKIARLFKRKDK